MYITLFHYQVDVGQHIYKHVSCRKHAFFQMFRKAYIFKMIDLYDLLNMTFQCISVPQHLSRKLTQSLMWCFSLYFNGLVQERSTVYHKKYAHGFVVLCFVVVMQSFIMNSHDVFIHIHQSCFAGTGAIVRLPQCQWSKPDGYGKISQCITTTKHSKAKTVCLFLGIYCTYNASVLH